MNSLLKKILKIIVAILLIILLLKVLIIFGQNTVVGIIKSDRFHLFLKNQIEYHIIKYGNSISDTENDEILNKNLKKIIKKWKPVFEIKNN